jgi:hypothetical protein
MHELFGLEGGMRRECIFFQVLFKVWFKFYYLAGVISL